MKSFRAMFFGTAVLLFLLFTAGGARSATTISLVQGWNLISLPLQQPVNTPVATVLSGIGGFYEVVWAYSNGAWKVYDPNDTAGSTLKTMQAGNGYWIKMLSAKKLSVSGSTPSPSTIPLVSGWNLVGFNGPKCLAPSDPSAGLAATAALANYFQVLWGYPSQGWESYDPTNGAQPSGFQLCPGAGYWIGVSGTSTWALGSVSGTAAQGSPIGSATVTLVDKNGNTAGGTTGSDGSFAFSGTGSLTPPFMLQVQTGSGNLYSVSADPNANTTINVTPLTDMIIRSWYTVQGTTVNTAFTSPGTYSPPTPTDVKVISSVVLSIVEGWLQNADVDTNNFNLISTPFAANGTGVDGVLDLTGVDQTTGIVTITGSNATQSSTVTPSTSGSVSVSTTQTIPCPTGTGTCTTSPVTTSTVVPTTPTQATALAGINTTITNFMNTVNLKGASLTGSDLAPYVDPNYLYNGEGAAAWEANVAAGLAGYALTFSGLQINSLDASTNIADVTFQITQTKNSVTMSQPVETNFKQINGAGPWLITGNGHIADAYAQTWAWYRPVSPGVYQYGMDLTLAVGDPLQNNVKSVTVSGPDGSGINKDVVPLICSYNAADCNSGACPLCENSHGSSGAQKAFELDLSSWPSSLPATYTFTLTTASGTQTYTTTVTNEFGFEADGVTPVPADYPWMTFKGGNPILSQILDGNGGQPLTGTVYVPVWVQDIQDPPHFNYEGPGGNSNSVSNIDIEASWTSGGFAIPGQVNPFTITIPAATNVTPYACGSGTCYTITFKDQNGQNQTGQIQGGWFGYDAGYGNAGDSSAGGAFTNNGVEVTQ